MVREAVQALVIWIFPNSIQMCITLPRRIAHPESGIPLVRQHGCCPIFYVPMVVHNPDQRPEGLDVEEIKPWTQRSSAMKLFRLAAVGSLVGILASGSAWAQQQQQRLQDREQQASTQKSKQLCLGSKLIGMTAKAQQEEVGQVKDLIINSEGHVQYLAIGTHARGQIGERGDAQREPAPRQLNGQERGEAGERRAVGQQGQLTVVPWEAVQLQDGETEAQQFVMIQVEKDRLMQAPKFTQQQLTQQLQQAQWTAQVDRFFNIERRGVARPELEQNRQEREQPRRQQDN
jgi:hypothetical protein